MEVGLTLKGAIVAGLQEKALAPAVERRAAAGLMRARQSLPLYQLCLWQGPCSQGHWPLMGCAARSPPKLGAQVTEFTEWLQAANLGFGPCRDTQAHERFDAPLALKMEITHQMQLLLPSLLKGLLE